MSDDAPKVEPAPIWAIPPTAPVAEISSAPRRSRLKLGIVAAVSAVIVIGGGVAVANAASTSNAVQGGGPGGQGRGGYGGPGGIPGGPGGFQRGGMAGGLVGALHGDFVVKDSSGKYVTERLQTGTVTAVSATSITVKSEDEHATTFTVGSATKVDNGAAKIADVKVGDAVTTVGTVSGDTVTATEISDAALLRQAMTNNPGNRPGGGGSAHPTPSK
jgi:hypothetical protein